MDILCADIACYEGVIGMPAISVIVPAYNAEKYIVNCVESIRKQTFQDWELVIVNDGSKDKTRELCDQCVAGDERIRVIHLRKNAGVSNARNVGMSNAQGEYIMFLDADDRYEFHCLQTMWDTMKAADADTAACGLLYLWPDGSKATEISVPAGVYDEKGIREKIVYPLLGDRLTQPVFNGYIVRYLYSAEIIRNAKITFEGAYLEDELFVMEYFCHAKKLAATEEPLYRYFQNPSSATHYYMADFLKVFSRFMERKEELVARYQLNDARPQWRENSNWAGLLIAIGNEYAASNKKSIREKQKTVKEICQRPEMAKAVSTITPVGLSANKQMVAKLVKGKHFFILTQLYRLKNRI